MDEPVDNSKFHWPNDSPASPNRRRESSARYCRITHDRQLAQSWSVGLPSAGRPTRSKSPNRNNTTRSPRAKYVVFFAYDDLWESIDMDGWHPQTLLAYGMNGQNLPAPHGAPIRLRVPRQLGYKSLKYLAQITLVDSLKDFGQGLGSISPELGYSWYAGI